MREIRELNRVLRYYAVPHTLASALATASMVVGTLPLVYGFALLAGGR